MQVQLVVHDVAGHDHVGRGGLDQAVKRLELATGPGLRDVGFRLAR